MILECGGACKANMGIVLKLLCPRDVPAKAHKLILNSTTTPYEQLCLEEHVVDVVFDTFMFGQCDEWECWEYNSLLDLWTNELIEYPVWPISGEYDRIPWEWEILKRELLLNNCIQFKIFDNC